MAMIATGNQLAIKLQGQIEESSSQKGAPKMLKKSYIFIPNYQCLNHCATVITYSGYVISTA